VSTTSWDVVVIGAGPAGLFAAAEAASRGRRTLLLEKNRRAGVKILASGGTRCNVTTSRPAREVGDAFGRAGARFLGRALATLDPDDVRALLAAGGVATHEEAMEKVFPNSGKATDVADALLRRQERSGARLATYAAVRGIAREPDGGLTVALADDAVRAHAVVLAVGGRSYPSTGTTGDGYTWARALGHTVTPTFPALVPLVVEDEALRALRGVAVEDAIVEAIDAQGRRLARSRRPLLLTHFGVSGPAPMDVSGPLLAAKEGGALVVDLAPGTEAAALDTALREAARRSGGRRVETALDLPLPRRLVVHLLARSGIPEDRRLAELARGERERLVANVKRLRLPVSDSLGFLKAEVTRGGVALDEVDPRTMESRLVPGLFIAGEILDLDGPIGGFNFQAAFSTGTLAGRHAGSG
jgi:hypothetical protein